MDDDDEEAAVDKEAIDAIADDGVTITASPEKVGKGPEEEPPSIFTMPKADLS